MPRDLDLKRRLELAGLQVIEVAGWQTRGSSTFSPRGGVNHHTAGPRLGISPSLNICINGRSDLPGPLCNTYGSREERLQVHLVAAGRANHAGTGGWKGLSGNSSVYGHEEEHVGTSAEGLSAIRLERMVRVQAAFAYGKYSADYVCQHWEWTSRKIDFAKIHVNPVEFRNRVAERMRLMANPAPPKPPEEKKVANYMLVRFRGGDGKVWLVDAGFQFRRHVKDQTELAGLHFLAGSTAIHEPAAADALGKIVTQCRDVATIPTVAQIDAAIGEEALAAKLDELLGHPAGGGGTPLVCACTPENIGNSLTDSLKKFFGKAIS